MKNRLRSCIDIKEGPTSQSSRLLIRILFSKLGNGTSYHFSHMRLHKQMSAIQDVYYKFLWCRHWSIHVDDELCHGYVTAMEIWANYSSKKVGLGKNTQRHSTGIIKMEIHVLNIICICFWINKQWIPTTTRAKENNNNINKEITKQLTDD